MIGYTIVGTNDLDRALEYYDALFGAFGIGRLKDFPRGTVYGTSFAAPMFGVMTPYNEEPATVGNGVMVSLVMESRAKVHAFHAKALELGGTDDGAPGVRGDEGPVIFYGAYFRDLDGNKLCAFNLS